MNIHEINAKFEYVYDSILERKISEGSREFVLRLFFTFKIEDGFAEQQWLGVGEKA